MTTTTATPKDVLLHALRKERRATKDALRKTHRLQERIHALSIRITDLTVELEQARLDLARADVLHTKHVPDRLADYVTGSTPEQLEASADRVLSAERRIHDANRALDYPHTFNRQEKSA